MDGAASISFAVGIIGCVIGVLSFASNRMDKAEQNGSMETKIDQALEGISDLKKKLEESSANQHSMDLMVRSHDEQIRTLFRMDAELKASIAAENKTYEVLADLLKHLKEHS